LAEPITFLQVNPHYHNLTKCFTSKWAFVQVNQLLKKLIKCSSHPIVLHTSLC
jgi:hypothetical protein